MDRTIIAPWKAEEKELSEKLFKKLQALTLLFQPTEAFKKCVTEDMFIKPNQQAFFHVMHFLFRILDPAEFKKRFFWPIVDKRSESIFRTSTVEYLKYLNEKHQLQWSHIKSYLVVMPGGMKFINFLLDFVGFVVQELTRQREKQICSDLETGELSELNLKRMRRQNLFFKEYASAYISEVDTQIALLCEKKLIITNELNAISQITGLNVTQLESKDFLEAFLNKNQKLFQEHFVERAAEIVTVENPLCQLKAAIENFQSKEVEATYDKDKTRQAFRLIADLLPTIDIGHHDELFMRPCEDIIKVNALMCAFNSIHAIVEESLTAAEQNFCASEFVSMELGMLKTELQQIESQITDFQKLLNTNIKKKATIESRTCNEKTLLMKFVSTPPIKLELPESCRNVNVTRLPLIGDFDIKTADSYNGFLMVPPRSVRKQKYADSSFDQNNTMNKSRIINPVELLRTIQKDTSKSYQVPMHNLSALGTKWKERQYLFKNELDPNTTISPKKGIQIDDANSNNTVRKCERLFNALSPFTQLAANDHTRIARHQVDIDKSVSATTNAFLYANIMSAVKKVQNDSLNIQNLSTSPSGRLEPLVAMPKVQLNNVTVNEEVLILNTTVEPKAMEKSIDSPETLIVIAEAAVEEKENDPSALNTSTGGKFDMNLFAGDEDELFNISDSVLKDVTM